MKNIYDTNWGQLITLWVFALLLLPLLLVASSGSEENIGLMALLLSGVFAIIFYTFGWLTHRNKNRLG